VKGTKLSEDVRPITDLKTRAAEIVDQARTTFVQAVEEGAKAVQDGDVHPHDEAVAILESFGK